MISFKASGRIYRIHPVVKLRTIYDILNLKEQEDISADFNSAVGIVSILSGCPISDLEKLSQGEFGGIFNEVSKVLNFEPIPPVVEFELGTTKYGLIHFDELTVGEIADIEMIQNSKDSGRRVHELLSILYRPITGRYRKYYTVEPYDSIRCKERSADFLDVDMNVINAATGFFLSMSIHFINHTLDYLLKKNLQDQNPQDILATLTKLPGPGQISST